MKVFNVPIEPLEERYSTQWAYWFENAYKNHNIPCLNIIPNEVLTDKIETGAFLDVFGTNHFKAMQMAELVKLLHQGEIKDGDWIFFHDLWFPGIEALAYIRDAAKIKFKIAGCLHAGTWDDYDFLTKQGMKRWANHFEKSFLEIADLIFVATNFHKRMIENARGQICSSSRDKIVVSGFPIYQDGFARNVKKDENLVLFPHRLDTEKQPHLFDELKYKLSDTLLRFSKTKEKILSKAGYYKLLNKGGYAISFALQETWGIAMQEALFCGCIPFVPDGLSYEEMYPRKLRFGSMKDLLVKLRMCIENEKAKQEYKYQATQCALHLASKGELAISNMIAEMRSETCL